MRKTLFELMQEQMQKEINPVANIEPVDIDTLNQIKTEITQSIYDNKLKVTIEKIMSNLPVNPDMIKSTGLKGKGINAKKTTDDQLRKHIQKLEFFLKQIKEELNKDEH